MKKLMTLLSTLCFVGMLSGCWALNLGNSIAPQNNNNQLEGADWRTTGIIDAYGTINYGQEASVNVCALKKSDEIALYYDEENQILYADLYYPRKLAKDELELTEITFEDRYDDGNTDVVLTGTDQQGETVLQYVFLCNSAGDFSYSDDESFDVYGDRDEYEPQMTEEPAPDGGQGSTDYTGYYTDGRMEISIGYVDGIEYQIICSFPNSAEVETVWTMTGHYAESSGELTYNDCECIQREYDPDTDETYETQIYYSGCGTFWFDENDNLRWTNEAEDDCYADDVYPKYN